MKSNSIVVWLMVCVMGAVGCNQLNAESKIIVGDTIASEFLNKDVKFSIYLPSGVECFDSLPVIYLLHGVGGNEKTWIKRCGVKHIFDSLIAADALKPCVAVMPSAENSYFINNFDSTYLYEDHFVNELIPEINRRYNLCADKSQRAICGFSMGGYGAAIQSIKYPDLYGTCLIFSGALRTDSMLFRMPQKGFENYYQPVFGPERKISRHWKDNSPYHLMDTSAVHRLRELNLYIYSGMNDYLFPANDAFHELLLKYRIPHQFHMTTGKHQWESYREGFIQSMIYWSNQSL